MVLLDLLHQLAAAHHWRLAVAHLNHRLRGRESDGDAKLCQGQCEALGVTCFAGEASVKELSRTKKVSIEMAAREARHEFLTSTARRNGFKRIGLAHHRDDQVELFFLRLFRGAGGAGLSRNEMERSLGVCSGCQPGPPVIGC